MTAVARLDRSTSPTMTIAAFEAWVGKQVDPGRYELVTGVVVMMANPTETHNQIAANIAAPLKIAMDRRRCRTYIADMRVQRSDRMDEGDRTKPDIVVRCGEHTGKTYITDPINVVEVLSPTTMDIDRGAKLEFYQSLPTLSHIAFAYQDQCRVEHYRRIETGWEIDVLKTPADLLRFDAVGFSIDLATVYFDLDV
jgi:Uma2 family endonuclease